MKMNSWKNLWSTLAFMTKQNKRYKEGDRVKDSCKTVAEALLHEGKFFMKAI